MFGVYPVFTGPCISRVHWPVYIPCSRVYPVFTGPCISRVPVYIPCSLARVYPVFPCISRVHWPVYIPCSRVYPVFTGPCISRVHWPVYIPCSRVYPVFTGPLYRLRSRRSSDKKRRDKFKKKKLVCFTSSYYLRAKFNGPIQTVIDCKNVPHEETDLCALQGKVRASKLVRRIPFVIKRKGCQVVQVS